MSQSVVDGEEDKALISDAYRVYKRRKKTSKSVNMEQQAKQDDNLVPKSPVKPKTNKVYLRRFKKKKIRFDATKTMVHRSFAAVSLCLDSSGCTDLNRDDFKPLEIVGSHSENLGVNGFDLEKVRDSRDDTGACRADNDGYTITVESNRAVKDEVGIIVHTLTDGSDPVPLFSAEDNIKEQNVSFTIPGDRGSLLLTKSPASDVDQCKSRDDTGACKRDNNGNAIRLDPKEAVKDEISIVVHPLTDGSDPVSLSSAVKDEVCIVVHTLTDVSDPVPLSVAEDNIKEQNVSFSIPGDRGSSFLAKSPASDVDQCKSRDDTGASKRDNNGYAIRLDPKKAVKDESSIVVHTLTDGSDPVSLSSAEDNINKENMSFSFPGDRGFLLLTKSPASDVDQYKGSPDSGITQDGQPSAEQNLNEASREKPETGFGKEPTQRMKKRIYRPRIMYEGKQKRRAKASNSKPATPQKKNLFKKPRKEKKNDSEMIAGPETPSKENLSKRMCEEKSKQSIIIEPATPSSMIHGSIIEPATPSPMTHGISINRVSTDVVRSLKFDFEAESMEENHLSKPVVDANASMVGDPKAGYPNEDHEKEIDTTRSLESELRRSERIQRRDAALGEKELRHSKCLIISRNLEPNFPVRFKRTAMLRKKRADLSVFSFMTRSDFLKLKPSSCKRKGKRSKTFTFFEYTRKKRSKRIPRVNISDFAATLFFNRPPERTFTSANQNKSNKKVKLASAGHRETRVSKDKDIPFLLANENQLSFCREIQMMESFNVENQLTQTDLRFIDKETSQRQKIGAKLSELELLHHIPVPTRLKISSVEILMKLEDTRKLSMRSGCHLTSPPIKGLFSHDLELIIEKMRVLNISEEFLDFNPLNAHLKSQAVVLSHMAQLPKSMVLHEKSTKQKKKVAKAALDQETVKEWHLLMMNNVKVGDDADEARKKKWEGERESFRGRVDLFIKRMHLLQADRKFKPWKGSVVDSVVGVFLTQNVSDNLSSSAYMSLAAKFPLKSTQNLEEDEETIVNYVASSVRYYIDEALEEDGGLEGNEPIVKHEMSLLDTKDQRFVSLPEPEVSLSTEVERFVSLQEPEVLLSTESARLEIQPDIEEPKPAQRKNKKTGVMEDETVDWKENREKWSKKGPRDRSYKDSVDWNAVKSADLNEVAKAIIDRGQQVQIAGRIQEFLKREAQENQVIDLEWLRDAPPDLVKRYLLEVNGLGLKSVECIRLLALKHVAFPVDTNVARIAVRLGWVPLEPLPEGVQMHLLEQYPLMDSIQKYLWPRLCTLGQESLYELHYQLITFGKVFCTKRSPNCNACPMKAECRHFASEYASKRLALMGSQENTEDKSETSFVPPNSAAGTNNTFSVTQVEEENSTQSENQINSCEPIVEMPPSPVPEVPDILDIEEVPDRTTCKIPDISMDMEAFKRNVQDAMQMIKRVFHNQNENDISKALVPLTPEKACIPLPTPRVKYYSKLRTEHVVYVLPDDHELLKGFERREPDDPTPYLLVKWQPGETAYSSEQPTRKCILEGSELCNDQTCASCCNIREGYQNTYRGTILIPCRTAMRGRFPLNGTYFQINEVFADDETSFNPITFPRELIDRLETRALYCGSSVSAIFRGLDTRRIQLCFWTGYVCVRGFDRVKRLPKETSYRLHTPPSKKGKKFDRKDADE